MYKRSCRNTPVYVPSRAPRDESLEKQTWVCSLSSHLLPISSPCFFAFATHESSHSCCWFFYMKPFLLLELPLHIPLFKTFQTSNQQAEIMCELCDTMPCHKFLPCFWSMTALPKPNRQFDNNCLSVNKTLCTSRTKAKVLQLKGNYRVQRTKLHSSLHL